MDARLPISVLLLVRDEVADLEQLLPTLGFASEVVLVRDPRGDERVRTTAERFGARVLDRAFDGFGPQRAFALAACRHEWVLWLDADERLDAEAVAGLAGALRDAGPATHFRIARSTWFLGRRIRWCGWQGETVLRLFRRERARFDAAEVHETVAVEGPGPRLLPGRIEHLSYRTWDDCVGKMVAYATANAAKAHRQGRRAGPLDVLLRPPLRFMRQYLFQLGVLDGAHGLVLCALASTQVLLKYAALWERTRADRSR